jgi:Protein of unknown function (DUF3262)
MSAADWANLSLAIRTVLGMFVFTWAAWQTISLYRAWLARSVASDSALFYVSRTFLVVLMFLFLLV